jgi:hypothetical protein
LGYVFGREGGRGEGVVVFVREDVPCSYGFIVWCGYLEVVSFVSWSRLSVNAVVGKREWEYDIRASPYVSGELNSAPHGIRIAFIYTVLAWS